MIHRDPQISPLLRQRGGQRPKIVRDQDVCVHCGACVVHCHTRALTIDSTSFEVAFRDEQCSRCGLCIPACSFAAISASGRCRR